MRVRFAGITGGLALVALLAGCGSAAKSGGAFNPSGNPTGAPQPQGSPIPSAATPTAGGPGSMTTPQLTASALDAYRAYQGAYARAYATNDPTGLDQFAMDPLLSAVVADVNRVKAGGELWRFYNALNPKLQAYNHDKSIVWVLDCVRTLALNKFSAHTGKLISKLPGGTKYYQVELRYGGNGWRAANAKWGGKC